MSDVVKMYDEATHLREEGKLEESQAKLAEIIKIDETYALAHSAMAIVLEKQGQHEQAIRHALKVCELEPHDPFNYTALSMTYKRAYDGTSNPAYIQLAEDAMAKSQSIGRG